MQYCSLLLWSLLVLMTSAFNLEPSPSSVVRQTSNRTTYKPTLRSTYFGYSLLLRPSSLIVSAPRAQSSSALQRTINETGVIFRCHHNHSAKHATNQCAAIVIENRGNIFDERSQDDGLLKGEKRDYQWLGAAMDGGARDGDSLAVCAPRLMSDYSLTYLMHGICYWANDTNADKIQWTRIKPLIGIDDQYLDVQGTHYRLPKYMFAQMGVSVHQSQNGKTILIGAPGIWDWSGSVVKMSRGDSTRQWSSLVGNSTLPGKPKFAYLGYAVTSGDFYEGRNGQEWLVASAPRAAHAFGEVHVFAIDQVSTVSSIVQSLRGHQMGEYFGYALVAADFNRDGVAELVVAAPFHANEDSYDNGKVYVYGSRGAELMQLVKVLVASGSVGPGERFGTALSSIGDIDGDGFNDLAVGAPFENDGVVYIFRGGRSGLSTTPSQRIYAPKMGLTVPAMFGFSISKGCDVDDNNFPDLAIGAPNAEMVFIYRSYPVVRLHIRLRPQNNDVDIAATTLSFQVCWKVIPMNAPLRQPINILLNIGLDKKQGRLKINNNSNYQMTVSGTAKYVCTTLNASLSFKPEFVFRPIRLAVNFELADGIPNSDEFCEQCVVVNPADAIRWQTSTLYETGCADQQCVADLRVLVEVEPKQPFVLGSSRSLLLTCTVSNAGETSFMTQLQFNTSRLIAMPSNCRRPQTDYQLDDDVNEEYYSLLCDVGIGGILQREDRSKLQFYLDTTVLTVPSIRIGAYVWSASNERNFVDNRQMLDVAVEERSAIEIVGQSTDLSETHQLLSFQHMFEIRNNGPSAMAEMQLVILIPVRFANDLDARRLIELHNVTCSMGSRTFIAIDPISTNDSSSHIPGNSSIDFMLPIDLLGNRTSQISCLDSGIECMAVSFVVTDWKGERDPIVVLARISVDLSVIESIRITRHLQSAVVVHSTAFVRRIASSFATSAKPSVSVTFVSNPYSVLRLTSPTPWWIFVASISAGLIFLIAIVAGLYKRGFFLRETLESFQREHRVQSERLLD